MSALTTTPVWSTIRPRLARYLPAETFNRLLALPDDLRQLDDAAQRRAAQQLLKANRALEPLRRTLLQYMPRYLIELAPLPGQARGEILSGSFMHADLKGFTALTELLARQGRARGQEEMNRMLNKLFSSLLDPLIASGGDLLIFAGDAALAYFPAQDDAEDTLQAARAGLRMQRAIKPFSTLENEFGQCSLSMRIGVERGQAYAGVVGDAERMELLVSGSGVHAAMLAEAQAEPGRVFLGESARQAAAGHFTLNGAQVVDDLGDDLGDYEVSPPTRKRGGALLLSKDLPDVLQTLNVSLQHVERLAPFLPEDMLARLDGGAVHQSAGAGRIGDSARPGTGYSGFAALLPSRRRDCFSCSTLTAPPKCTKEPRATPSLPRCNWRKCWIRSIGNLNWIRPSASEAALPTGWSSTAKLAPATAANRSLPGRRSIEERG